MEIESLVTDPKFLTEEYLSTLHLKCGSGTGKEGDRCALQERRFWSGLDSKSFDVPATDSQVCGRFMIRFQDAIKDDAIRNRLIPPLMVKLVGSAGSKELEQRRSWLAVDWAWREVAPLYFDMSPELAIHAAALRALPPITSRAAATAAYSVRDAARSAAWNLRQARLATFREKFEIEFKKRMPAAAAEEVAGSDRYWPIYYAVRDAIRQTVQDKVREHLRESSVKSWESGAKCLERMLDLKEESSEAA